MNIVLRGSLVVMALMLLAPSTKAGEPRVPQQPPLILTLEKAISMALEQNRDILIADQERYKADAQIAEAWSGALPQISITGQYLRNIKKPVLFLGPNTPFNTSNTTETFELGSDNSYQAGAQFSQVLFNRQIGLALDIANTYHDYSEQGFHATQQDIILQLKKAFYAVLFAQKLAEANRQGLEVVRANYENVQSQYRYGNAAEYELLRAEVQLANTEPLLISAENNLLLAKNALKSLLAMPLDQDIELQGQFTSEEMPPEAMAEARRNALTANPSIAQLALQESILEKNIGIERSNYFPTLSLFGSYQWQTQDNTFQFRDYNWAKQCNVGLQLSYPLFDGFRTSSRIQEASVDKEKVHYARLKAEEGLKIQIQSAELKMAEARKRIEGQEKNISQARKALSIAETRYKNGVGTQLELLDTQVAMTRAQTNYAQAMYDYLVAKAEWQYAVGMPT
jgi:outer membrane protein